MLATIASQLAGVVYLHRLSQEREMNEQRTSRVVDVVRDLSSAGYSMGVEELLQAVLKSAQRALFASAATVLDY